jgi:hypothetical protein
MHGEAASRGESSVVFADIVDWVDLNENVKFLH